MSPLEDNRSKEKVQLLLSLLSGTNYPEIPQIEAAAEKFGVPVEDLRKLFDRVFGEA